MSAVNNVIFKNYPEADKYRKHLSIEEKAKLYDLICNILPYEAEAFDKVWKTYGDKWTDDHSKGIDSYRIHAFHQLMAILDSALKPDVSDLCVEVDNIKVYAPTYRTVDVDLTLDKLCKFLSDTFDVNFIWGRDVLADCGREVRFFIRSVDDSSIRFMDYGEEFTPLWDDWWGLLNHYIPTYLLNTDVIDLYKDGRIYNQKPNPLKGVKNAKKLFEKLVELGY